MPQTSHPFTTFKDAKILTYDELRALSAAQVPLASMPSCIDQYSIDEVSSIRVIQRFWRKWSEKLKHHQEYLKSSEAQAVAKYIAMGSQPPNNLHMRAILVSEGLELSLQLSSAKDLVSPLRKRVMAEIESIEDSDDRYDVLDDALHECTTVEDDLKEISSLMSEGNLKDLVAIGQVPEMSESRYFLFEIFNRLVLSFKLQDQ